MISSVPLLVQALIVCRVSCADLTSLVVACKELKDVCLEELKTRRSKQRREAACVVDHHLRRRAVPRLQEPNHVGDADLIAMGLSWGVSVKLPLPNTNKTIWVIKTFLNGTERAEQVACLVYDYDQPYWAYGGDPWKIRFRYITSGSLLLGDVWEFKAYCMGNGKPQSYSGHKKNVTA